MTSSFMCDSSHNFLFYANKTPETFVITLVLREIKIPTISIFIEHAYLQHACGGLKGPHSLRYHIYCTYDTYDLLDAVAFSYVCIMSVEADKFGETATGSAKEE